MIFKIEFFENIFKELYNCFVVKSSVEFAIILQYAFMSCPQKYAIISGRKKKIMIPAKLFQVGFGFSFFVILSNLLFICRIISKYYILQSKKDR